MIQDLLNGFCDLVYPPRCLFCRKSLKTLHQTLDPHREILCVACKETLGMNQPPFCPKCSRPRGLDPDHRLCQTCSAFDLQFDFAWGACPYTEPLRGLIHRFKFEQRTYLRYLFSRLMVEFIKTYCMDIHQFDIIVPMPLSTTRFRERGYNQSELLAAQISSYYEIPLCTQNLLRARHSPSQSALSLKERWTNVQGAFRIKNHDIFKGRSVLIIDDLLTTGATASQAASAVKKAEANTVGVLTLAIAV